MHYRLLFSFLLLISYTSCKDNLSIKNNVSQELDTIIDFSKVDVSPYFKVCEKLLDEAKTNCFRINIQTYFTKKLKKLELRSKKSIDEKIIVILLVDKKGRVRLKELIISDEIASNFPNFQDSIDKIVASLPKLSPALKRGIPVTTEYKLPINIVVQ